MPDLRSKLKSGPLNEIYGYARWAKRRLTGEQIETTGIYDPTPLPLDALRALAEKMPTHGRRYFTLALGYLDTEEAANLPRALACLRCAETLNFESPERLALYSALILAKYGEPAQAGVLLQPYAPEEFTPAENALRERILAGNIAQAWQAQEDDSEPEAERAALQRQGKVNAVLVVGDVEARTARWFPHARYFLAAPEVNGVSLEQMAQCGLRFDLGVGPAQQIAPLKDEIKVCGQWLEIA